MIDPRIKDFDRRLEDVRREMAEMLDHVKASFLG
jgi:hypothetical protein